MGEWFVRNRNGIQDLSELNPDTNISDMLLTEKAIYGNKKGIVYLIDEKCNV